MALNQTWFSLRCNVTRMKQKFKSKIRIQEDVLLSLTSDCVLLGTTAYKIREGLGYPLFINII